MTVEMFDAVIAASRNDAQTSGASPSTASRASAAAHSPVNRRISEKNGRVISGRRVPRPRRHSSGGDWTGRTVDEESRSGGSAGAQVDVLRRGRVEAERLSVYRPTSRLPTDEGSASTDDVRPLAEDPRDGADSNAWRCPRRRAARTCAWSPAAPSGRRGSRRASCSSTPTSSPTWPPPGPRGRRGRATAARGHGGVVERRAAREHG